MIFQRAPGPATESAVVAMATQNPWYGYKRIAVMCRRACQKVTNRQCYRVMKAHGLLQKAYSDPSHAERHRIGSRCRRQRFSHDDAFLSEFPQNSRLPQPEIQGPVG